MIDDGLSPSGATGVSSWLPIDRFFSSHARPDSGKGMAVIGRSIERTIS